MEFHKGRALAKFLVVVSLLAVVFAVIASSAQLWFFPPSQVNAAWTPPHLLAYEFIWNWAREVVRWALSHGLLPEEVRQFKSQGVPAFLPWLALAAALLVLASFVGLVSLFIPSSAHPLKHEAEPTLVSVSGEGAQDVANDQPRMKDPSSGNDQQRELFDKLVEESLLYSEAQLSHAQDSVERLRRALVNVYLDAGSTATEDMQDLRISIEELEITLETLKGEQHRVMAALVSQAPHSLHVSASSH